MNWQSVIGEIRASGRSQSAIASAVGCTQATISDLQSGRIREPRHSLGVSLLALRDLCLAEAPQEEAAQASEG